MRKTKLFAALLAALALLLAPLSCSSESGEDEEPAKQGSGDSVTSGSYAVRSVTTAASSASVVLAWVKPADTSNYGGVKISWGSGSSQSISVDSDTTTYTVNRLSASTSYKFTLTTLDSSKKETSSSVSLSVKTPAAQTAGGSDENDTAAPADITELAATNLDGAVLLTWEDPGDEDLFGIEITCSENTSARSVAAMEKGSIFAAPGTQSATISSLVNGTSYTFILKAMDTSGNKSNGESVAITPSIIQGNTMQIALALSTTDATNEDVTVGIAITTDAGSVTTVKYASGEKDVSYFAQQGNGTAISADGSGAYSFAAGENGTYTVYVLDSDGRRETKTATIENIDKTAPKEVSDLAASYSSQDRKITVTWTTLDTDIDHYLVSYSVDGVSKAADESASAASYSIENVEASSGTYTFTVKAVDKAGNIGEESTASVTPEASPYISKITLDRKHIAYNTENKTINVTVQGGNFGLISSNSDDPTLKIQLVSKDGTNVYDTETASIDTVNNTATAAITAPALTSSSRDGTEYTVRAKVCGNIDTEHTAALNISEPGSVYSISLSTKQIAVGSVESGQTTTATVDGYNFDAHSNITLQLYGSTNTAYGDAVSIDMSAITSQEYSTGWTSGGLTVITGSTTKDKITAEILIPTVDDTYTLKVLFDGAADSQTAELQVYGAPTFSSFTIPSAGTAKEDSTVTAIVKGKNFTAPDITASSFSVTCAEKPSVASGAVVTVQDDSTLKVSLNIPGAAGEYKVTVSSGSGSCEGTFTVKDYSSFKAGQIVLADGSLAESGSYTAIDTANPPVAVVAGFNDNGVAFAVGLHKSSSFLLLQWASSGSTSDETKFSDIICTPSVSDQSGVADKATFTGDTDGSDNWSVICSVDPEGSEDAAANYPAFNWANTYGATYKDYLGNATEGWYMPSIAELCHVYRNREAINATLAVVSKLNSSYADSSLGTNWFWSSSQYSGSYSYAWGVSFDDGLVSYGGKSDYDDVLVVRAF